MRNRQKRSRAATQDGSALIIGIIFAIALAGLAMSLASVTVEESQSNEGASQKQRANYVAESGIRHAMIDVQSGGTGNLGTESTPISFGGGTYWVESTDHGNLMFTLVSRAQVGDQEAAYEVLIGPEDTPLFAVGMFSDGDVNANGNVFTDSYDADTGTYAEQATNVNDDSGMTYAGNNGDLGSNEDISLSGSVIVLGDASPGPGGLIEIGTGVVVDGSTTPAFVERPMPIPPYEPAVPSTGDFVSDPTDITLNAGDYHFDNFTAKKKGAVRISGDVRMWVDDGFVVGGLGQIILEPGATLKIYHNGTDLDLTGQGVLNEDQLPQNLLVFSSAETAKFTGGSGFYGAIYAPFATLTPVGTTDLYGAFVGETIDLGGTVNFHYDEGLRDVIANVRQYAVFSWRKVSVND
jgi:hypothetical protein